MYGEAVVKEVTLTGIVILYYRNLKGLVTGSEICAYDRQIVSDLSIYFITYIRITWIQRH